MSALKHAKLYRMVMPDHTCPYGLKSLDLLKRKGYKVEDKHLASREQTDAFKQEHGVETTPQTFIDGRRIGGYDELRKFFDMPVKDKNAVTYTPVVALFLMAAALALGRVGPPSASYRAFRPQSGSWPLPCACWRCRNSRTWTVSRRCSSTMTCWPSAGCGMAISTRSQRVPLAC